MGRRGASDLGLRQADCRAVGRLQKTAGQSGRAGEAQEAQVAAGRVTTWALTAEAISLHSAPGCCKAGPGCGSSAPPRPCGGKCPAAPQPDAARHWPRIARSASARSRARQVVPQPRGLLVGIAVLAIGHIGPLQVRHEGPALEQARLRILDAPKTRAQVPDQLQSSDAQPARQGAAVLGAGRRGPDHVKVAGREHGHGLPATHVGADGGLRPGIKIQAYYLPAQLREGPAHRPSPREQLQQSRHPRFPSRAGRRARSPQRIKRSSRPARDCTGRTPKAANAPGRPHQRAAHSRA